MGKKSKAAGADKRLREKRARKAAMQAQYQKYAEMGKNQKSKRNRNKKAGSIVRTTSHPEGKCGNTGCITCFGINFNQFLVNKRPVNMPQWMYMKWTKQKEQSNANRTGHTTEGV